MVLVPCKKKGTTLRSGSFHGSRKVDYSIYVLAALSCSCAPRSTRKIAAEGGLSFSFVQKIAYLLKRAGLVCATRGKAGGYFLARQPHTISVKNIIEAVEGGIPAFSCVHSSRVRAGCPRKNFCELRTVIDKARYAVEKTYLSKKLTDFIA